MPATQDPPRVERGATQSRLHLLSCIRLDEVLVLQGAPMFGALFSMGSLTRGTFLELLVFALASCCLVAHVFVLNDWCGASADLRDPNRAERVFTARGISPKAAGRLCAVLLALSLLLLLPFGPAPLWIALALAALSAMYSAPTFSVKGVPVLSSLLHFAGGLLHFLLGYSLFSAVDWRGVAIGIFFALAFVAGHLTQEVRDYEGDLFNGIRTNAVQFGPSRSFAAALVLFTAAHVVLVALAQSGAVPRILALSPVLFALQLWWTLQTALAGLTFDNIRRLQTRYRILYAIIGAIMIATVVHTG